jgi:hypothetical protein
LMQVFLTKKRMALGERKLEIMLLD